MNGRPREGSSPDPPQEDMFLRLRQSGAPSCIPVPSRNAARGSSSLLTARHQRTPWLEEITRFTAAGLPEHLASLIVCAYVTGCTVSQVLAAIEAGHALGELPSAALRVAWQTAHDWAWIARAATTRRWRGRPEDLMSGISLPGRKGAPYN